MLLSGRSELRLSVGGKNLRSLALAYGVVAESGDAMAGQHDSEPLVVFGSLSGPAVATGNEHRRVRRRGGWQIKCRRDVMPRLAFENDFFNLAAIASELSHD